MRVMVEYIDQTRVSMSPVRGVYVLSPPLLFIDVAIDYIQGSDFQGKQDLLAAKTARFLFKLKQPCRLEPKNKTKHSYWEVLMYLGLPCECRFQVYRAARSCWIDCVLFLSNLHP